MYGVISILHAVSWSIVFGYYFFWGVILAIARGKKDLDVKIENEFMKGTLNVLPPVMAVSWIVALATGVWKTATIVRGSWSIMYSTTWGWLVTVGFAATIAAILVGVTQMIPTCKAILAYGRGETLFKRLATLERINFSLVIVIMVVMLLAWAY